ncbi:sodium-coupled neutral amino acid transporter 7-like [Oppia nitens]|uniref:sodium-coupled neutral amino acid transporter 7-like n=1 Tax=Oppia nitens TaxID=1686743 RepID=UPI0023D9C589|nr:sodium-coupled neutral amino acid transporter 7-like [Oppia nitens]
MLNNMVDESLVPILSVGNEYETPSVSTRLSATINSNDLNDTQSGGQSSVRTTTTCLAAIFLTVNATLGAGLLNIPHAFNDSGGILCSLVIQTIFLIFIIGSLILLSHCADISQATSLQDIVLAFCGYKCQQFCSIIIILYSYGACITFVIIIGDQFDRIFLSLYGINFTNHWYLNRNFTMSITCVLFIIPLSFSKQISFLKNASLLGFSTTFYLIFLVIYQYLKSDDQMVWVKTRPNTWTEIFYITPVLSFSYQCQLSWVPTYAGMKHRVGSVKVILTIIASLVICYVSYTLTAIFGLLTFGSDYIENDLMSNYDANNWIVLIAILTLIAKTITVYPLLLFCGRVAVEDFIQMISQRINRTATLCTNWSHFEPYRRSIIVLTWIMSTIVMAINVPNITIAIQFLGSFATIFVFIFPAICFLKAVLIKDKYLYLIKDKFYAFIASIYIIIGVFILGLTVTATIDKYLLKL